MAQNGNGENSDAPSVVTISIAPQDGYYTVTSNGSFWEGSEATMVARFNVEMAYWLSNSKGSNWRIVSDRSYGSGGIMYILADVPSA